VKPFDVLRRDQELAQCQGLTVSRSKTGEVGDARLLSAGRVVDATGLWIVAPFTVGIDGWSAAGAPDAVVTGLDPNLTYLRLAAAADCVRAGARSIATVPSAQTRSVPGTRKKRLPMSVTPPAGTVTVRFSNTISSRSGL